MQTFADVKPGRLPLVIAGAYLLSTYLLFYIGPYDWPVTQWWTVGLYVPLLFFILFFCHLVALNKRAVHRPLVRAQTIYIIGAVAAVVLLVPSSRVYTGRWPWEFVGALMDQRAAYEMLREQLESTEGTRGLVVLARTLAAPFIFAVLPLGILKWKGSPIWFKSLLAATALCSVIFSILRGTTRELMDLLVIGSSAFAVMAGRQAGPSFILLHWKKAVVGALLAMVVVTALVGRTQARIGDTSAICLGNSGVCADLYSPPYGQMSDTAAFGMATVTGYLSQGYYGLSLAMEQPFVPGFGLGHSPALESLYRSLGGGEEVRQSTYSYRLRNQGWSEEYQWSTLFVWLANDISFWGVPFFMAFLGLIWGWAWVDASRGHDDIAAVFFCAIMMIIFYIPANNQMMSTLDAYATLLSWGFAYGLSRLRGTHVVFGSARPSLV